MKYIDCVYGEFEISEPIILELINSPSLQRLQGIDQAGYKPLWVNPAPLLRALKWNWVKPYVECDFTRFVHSVGVYLLLKKYGAPLEEQIAGLIHDVSHSAFSHCIDYALDSGSEKEHNHQDKLFDSFIRKTEIPEIIKKYGYDLEYILNDDNFPLKEKNLPDLCADRIDYSLKTAVIFEELNEASKNYLLNNLTVIDNNWVFKTFDSARKYAELFQRLNTKYFAGFPSVLMFKTVGDYLRYALQKGYINEDDLYTTDKAVLSKIEKYHDKDERLNLLFERMNKKVGCKNNPQDYDEQVFCKSRVVDPLCKHEGTMKRVSKIDHKWSIILEQESKPKQYFLKFDR